MTPGARPRSRARARAAALLALALASAGPARAQGEEPPPEYFAPGGSRLARAGLSPYGDFRLRFDRVEDRPGATDAIERWRGMVRAGLAWSKHPALALEAGLRSGMWEAEDDPLAAGFDNENGGEWSLDRLAVVIAPVPDLTIVLGKRTLPFETTDLTWDTDLRPVGVLALLRRNVGAYDEAKLSAAVVRRAKSGDDDVLAAIQTVYAFRPGAARGATLALGYSDYVDADPLAREGLGRQNQVVGTGPDARYASAFRALDAQIAARGRAAAMPLAAGVHAVRNLERSADEHGVRAWATVGELREWPRIELRYVFQQVDREALPGAYNSDDWWFHTRARGHRLSLAARPWPRATLRVSGFREHRYDVADPTLRLLVDLELRLLPE